MARITAAKLRAATNTCLHDFPIICLAIPTMVNAVKAIMLINGKTTQRPVNNTFCTDQPTLSISKTKSERTIVKTMETAMILRSCFRSCNLCMPTSFIVSDNTTEASVHCMSVSLILSDFISSNTLSPKASAKGSRVLISGNPNPRSQRLTALSVTCSFDANSACVIWFSFLVMATKLPNLCASI